MRIVYFLGYEGIKCMNYRVVLLDWLKLDVEIKLILNKQKFIFETLFKNKLNTRATALAARDFR